MLRPRSAPRPLFAVGRGGFPLLLAALLGPLVGCSTLSAEKDYARARELIRSRAEVESVYSPDEPPLERQRIDEMLADGLSQDEAVQIALLNNRELQAAFFDIGVARADWAQSGLLTNPSITTALRFPPVASSIPLDGSFALNIAELWQIPIRMKAAEGRVEETILAVAGAAADLAADVRRAYQQAVAAREALRLANEHFSRALAALEAAQQAGRAPIDLDLVRGDAMRAELAIAEAQLAFDDDVRRLARLMSLPSVPSPLLLTDPLAEPGQVGASEAQLVALARERRIDVQASARAVQTTADAIRTEYSRILPEFGLGLSIENDPQPVIRGGARSLALPTDTQVGQAGAALTRRALADATEQKKDTTLGPLITFELPIFDQNLAQIRRAKLLHEQAVRRHEQLDTVVVHEVAGHFQRFLTAARTVTYYRDQLLPHAETSLAGALGRFRNGESGALPLLDAQRTLADVRRSHLAARLAAAVAHTELTQAVGAPLGEAESIEITPPEAEAAPGSPAPRTIPPPPPGVIIRDLGVSPP